MAARRIEQPAILREQEVHESTPPEEQDAQAREQSAEQDAQALPDGETARAGDTSPAEPTPSTAPEAKPGESGRAAEPTLFVQGEVKAGTTIPIGVEQAQDGPGMFTVEFPNEVRTYYRSRPDEGFSINANVSGKYRVTLRQPNENGDLRVVGKPLTFEVL